MRNEKRILTQHLDQLLPFLEAAPSWFKIWIYVLVGLICVTLAAGSVFYLQTKLRAGEKRSFESFKILTPQDGDELPISGPGSWLIRGTFPVFDAVDGGNRDDVRLAAKVESLLNLEPIPQKDGRVDGPTADGFWRAIVILPGEGRYRIVVAAQLGKQQVVREVTVACPGKVSALARRMERDRTTRGAGQLPHIPPPVVNLNAVKRNLYEFQSRFFEALEQSNFDSALSVVTEALDVIDPALLSQPDDLEIQNFRAYFF